MKYNIVKVYQAQVVESDEHFIALAHVCHKCKTTPEIIIRMVNEGLLEPKGDSKTKWRFSFSAIDTIMKVQRLQNDLNINLAGAALALHLLEKVERLEARLVAR